VHRLVKPEGRGSRSVCARESRRAENFRPGVADRLGIGWDAVHAANPHAVMISVNGYGSDSSRRDHGAFAPTMHAATGLIEYQARKGGGPMVNLPDARADLTTSLHATIGLLAALRAAERSGEGQRVEIAMFDAVLGTYPETPFELLDPPEMREEPAPYDGGANGFVAVAGPPQHVWAVIAKAFALEDPAPPGADIPTKAQLRHAAIERWMAAQPSREALVAALERERILCAGRHAARSARRILRARSCATSMIAARNAPRHAFRTASSAPRFAQVVRRRAAASTNREVPAKCCPTQPPDR
jgi:crotonobetainyl-CoA:carnitine CoA-transferase CaiB-like acyl-CoA transferase